MDGVIDNSRRMIRRGSKSFSAAARLFDKSTRESAYMLYAWCRYCDDQIDGQNLGLGPAAACPASLAQIKNLCRETRHALAGDTMTHPVFIAFQRVVQQHRIPHRYPLELLEGFAMDVEQRRYANLEDTLLYCYHVAGVVGIMMAHVMGVRDQESLHRAADLGIAFQLTNIARDVMDDARVGRIYLPAGWLEHSGITAGEMQHPKHRHTVCAAVRRLLLEAEPYYHSAAQGFPSLGFRSAWAVATARGVYRDIGRLVAKRGPDAWDRRAVVSRRRKMYRALQGGAQALAAVSLGRLRRQTPRGNLWRKSDP